MTRRHRLRYWLAGLLREARSWPTVLTVLLCLTLGIPLVVLVTPDQRLQVLGQSVAVGARDPNLSLAGPAQIVQVGNGEFDLLRVRVSGPIRPRISIGPIQRNPAAARAFDVQTSTTARSDAVSALIGGFERWYLWGTVGVLLFAIAACALVGCARMLTVLRRQSRPMPHTVATITALWRRLGGALGRMTGLTVSASLLAWLACGALAYSGTAHGLRDITSLSDLVGSTDVSPSPVGPEVFGYSGAVIGDSRAARVGGPALPGASAEDTACERSADSLAAELGALRGARVENLACSGASIAQGLRGPQEKAGLVLPAQVGLLKQIHGLKFVVVAIGPNDLYWSDFLRYCYALTSCDDQLTAGSSSTGSPRSSSPTPACSVTSPAFPSIPLW